MDEVKMSERIATVEQDLKSIHRRLDNLDKLTESVYTLATELKATREDVSEISNRLAEVENKPIKRYDTVVTGIITLVLGAVVGLVFSQIGLK